MRYGAGMSGMNFEGRVPPGLGGRRLEEVLLGLLEGSSRSAVARLVRRGKVRVNGQRAVRSNLVLEAGWRVSVDSGRDARKGRPPKVELEVVYEDEHLAVVNKPAGMLCHGKAEAARVLRRDPRGGRGAGGLASVRGGAGGPGARRDRSQEAALGPSGRGAQAGQPARRARGAAPTLAELAVARFGRLPMLMGDERPGIVHRLDRETSGLIVVAKTGEAMEGLRAAFRERRVEKAYLAVVRGAPDWDECVLDWDLVDGAQDRRGWRAAGLGEQTARTSVEVLERGGEASLVICRPESGRRHQIRVHLFAAGHGIVGDTLYAERGVRGLGEGAPPVRRHMLHALGLALEHPVTGEAFEFEWPPPEDMGRVVDWVVGA